MRSIYIFPKGTKYLLGDLSSMFYWLKEIKKIFTLIPSSIYKLKKNKETKAQGYHMIVFTLVLICILQWDAHRVE